MKISIKATNIELTPALKEYIEQKIGSLSHLLSRWEEEGEVEARVEVARTTNHHKKGDVFFASVDMHLPGSDLHTEGTESDERAAIDRVKDTMQREVTKYKEMHVE